MCPIIANRRVLKTELFIPFKFVSIGGKRMLLHGLYIVNIESSVR